MEWVGCDSGRILADVESLRRALAVASDVNIPAHLVSDVKNDWQRFIGFNPVLEGKFLMNNFKLAEAHRLVDSLQGLIDKIDYDVEMRALPFDVHRRVIAPVAEAHRIAKDLLDASSACRAFKVPLEYRGFI